VTTLWRLGLCVAALAATFGHPTVFADASPAPGPASSARTNQPPTITLSISHGPVNGPFSVSGAGFPPGEQLVLYFDDQNGYCGTPIGTDTQGRFTTPCVINGAVPLQPGAHKLCADTNTPDANGNRQPIQVVACAPIVVDTPTITLSISEGTPKTLFTVTATGFPASEAVRIYLDYTGIGSLAPCGTPGDGWPPDQTGYFQVTGCMIGSASQGSHKVCGGSGPSDAAGQPEYFACAPLTIVAPAQVSSSPVTSPQSSPTPLVNTEPVGGGLNNVFAEVSIAIVGAGALAGLTYLLVAKITRHRRSGLPPL
jgi:hypothetical protein